MCERIAHIMGTYLPEETFHLELINEMVAEGIKGGQKPDGSQKDGFFQYEQKHSFSHIFNKRKKVHSSSKYYYY